MGIDRTGTNAPSFRLLDDDKVRALHEGALTVLAEVGLHVVHDEARRMLLDAGGTCEDELLVKVPRAMVEDALASAPSSFTLYDRNGEEALHLGAGHTYFGSGVTNLAFIDIDEAEPHDFTLDDIGRVAFLADALDSIDFVSTPGVIKPKGDQRIELVEQQSFLQMITNTTMPLVVLTPDAYQMEDIFEMAALVAGGDDALAAKPFLLPYLNTVTPLLVNPETVDKLFLAADRGIPACVQAAPPVGANVPVTIAGGIVVGAAETLMGLVLSQLRRPGTPFVSGITPFVMDMRSANTATTTPEIVHMVIAMGELTRSWGLPSVGTSACSDSKTPDEQVAFEIPYYTQAVVLGGMDLCFNVGRMECGLLHSPIALVYADEAVRMHERFQQGLEVNDETLALDVIAEVGPSGFFLGHQHTLDHFRQMWDPHLSSWEPRPMWEERGSTTMLERAKDRVRTLRAEHQVEPLPPETLAAMQAVIDRRAASLPDED